jgi:hypothetical protein
MPRPRPFGSTSDEAIEHWHGEQGKHGSQDHSAHEHDSDTVTSSRAWPRGDNEREVTNNGSHGGHENRTKSGGRRFNGGLQALNSLLLKPIRELHYQDSVLSDQANKGHKPYL